MHGVTAEPQTGVLAGILAGLVGAYVPTRVILPASTPRLCWVRPALPPLRRRLDTPSCADYHLP